MFENRSDPLFKYSWFPQSDSLYLSHLHEIILSLVFYIVLYKYIAPVLNSIVFGVYYKSIDNKKVREDFDIHTVSMVQAFISLYILYPTLSIPISHNVATYQDQHSSMVSALSAGYFIWDLGICIVNYDVYGLEFFAHAIGSLYVMYATLIPLCQGWVGKFLLFEASTPFVNINWYIIQLTTGKNGLAKAKVPMILNAINGLCLLSSFFFIRICWGIIANLMLYRQIWISRSEVPTIRALILVALNVSLTGLNVVWFQKMLKIAKKMANGSPKKN